MRVCARVCCDSRKVSWVGGVRVLAHTIEHVCTHTARVLWRVSVRSSLLGFGLSLHSALVLRMCVYVYLLLVLWSLVAVVSGDVSAAHARRLLLANA